MTPTSNRRRRPRILVLEGLRDAATCVRLAGGDPVVASPRDLATVDEKLIAGFDGLLLTGGGDISPTLYGEAPHRSVYGVNDTRDLVEWIALDTARDLDVPVLGICRGMQLMAVHNGGRLKQHIHGHRGTSHLVVAERGSHFKRIAGNAGVFVSLHHQRVLRHGPGWRVGARDTAGKIEAVESKDGRCVGVQFHPEMDHVRNPGSRKLFRWLVIEASKRAGIRTPRARPLPTRQLTLLPRETPRRSPTFPRPTSPAPRRSLASRWFCRDCGLEFDRRIDRDDHEYWICGTPVLRTMEPPPGHHDWLPLSQRGPEDAS